MNLLDIIPGQFKQAGKKNGGEYAGACPWCGDGGKGSGSDRFRIWPEQGRNGTYWCRMCGRGGDAIKYLIDHDGMAFKEALDRLGLHPDVLGPKRETVPVGWTPTAVTRPADIWADKARKFAYYCHERLLERSDEMGWLAERGIGIDMIKKYRLGWNPSHAWREGPAWGVTMDRKADGKLKKLWLPRGLVIPRFADFSENSRVVRLRVRQPDQSPRYMVIPGSNREPLISRNAEAMIVVESELDAILLDGIAGEMVGVVAMGNDTAKPTSALLPALEAALTILVALDSDLPKYNPTTDAMDIPGAKASRWWLQQFSQAVRVPVVGGKDPGEAYKAGIDLRSWVLAALPPYFHVKAELDAERLRKEKETVLVNHLNATTEKASQKPPVAGDEQSGNQGPAGSANCQNDDTGQQEEVVEQPAGADEQALVRTVTLTNGRSFCIAANRDEWQRLTTAGEVVFSEYELKRLQSACSTMTPAERLDAAMLVLDVKEIFGNAWIRRGEVVSDETCCDGNDSSRDDNQ